MTFSEARITYLELVIRLGWLVWAFYVVGKALAFLTWVAR